MTTLNYAGGTIEVDLGSLRYDEENLSITFQEQQADMWSCTIQMKRGQYEQQCQNSAPQATPQGALDAAAADWIATIGASCQSDIDALQAELDRIEAHSTA